MPALRVAPPDLRLVNWPLRDEGWRAWGLLTVLAAAATAVGWKLTNLPAGLLAGTALAVAAWRLWIPVTWELGYSGITETVLGRSVRIPWTSIAGWREYRTGVLLLPEADAAPILALRGRFVAWRNQRAELLALLEHYVGPTSVSR